MGIYYMGIMEKNMEATIMGYITGYIMGFYMSHNLSSFKRYIRDDTGDYYERCEGGY